MKSLGSFVLAILTLTACGGGGEPTGAVCPSTDPPTYANFGEAFFTKYCTTCHAAATRNRHDAPGDQNYDSEADILRHAADIDAEAAAGPAATNTSMPELGGGVTAAPTEAERQRLGAYLACLQQ